MKNTRHIKSVIFTALWFVAVMWKVRNRPYIPTEHAVGAFSTALRVFEERA